MRTFSPVDRVAAEECYLLYRRNIFGRRGQLIAAYRSASDCLGEIGLIWPNREKERLYAVYRNGNMREVTQTAELMKCNKPAADGATF